MAESGELLAGPDLNALIAERVMGWRRQAHPQGGTYWVDDKGYAGTTHCPDYSGDIKAAWQVVERLREKRWLVVIKVMPEGFPYWYAADDPRHFYARTVVNASYQPQKTPEECRRYIHGHAMGVADADALAICKCALAVIEEEERYAV